MTAMLEKMARAATENSNRGRQALGIYRPQLDDWSEISATARAMRIADMRAALDALAEPDERMVEAGRMGLNQSLRGYAMGDVVDNDDAIAAFTAMIRAARDGAKAPRWLPWGRS